MFSFFFFVVRFMDRSQFEFLKNKANMHLLTFSLTFLAGEYKVYECRGH